MFRGQNATSPIETQVQAIKSTTGSVFSTPALTTANPDAILWTGTIGDTGSGQQITIPADSGWTDNSDSTWHAVDATMPGSTGARIASSSDNQVWITQMIAIKPTTTITFPQRLKATNRLITNSAGTPVDISRGFNIHAVADFAQSHFTDIAALGGKFLRIICRWDDFLRTSGNISSSAITALDHTIARAAAAGLYCMIDFHIMTGSYPSWTSAQAAGEQKFKVYGQNLVQYLANRYGKTLGSPQYSVNVVGMGPNELPVDDTTVRNGTGSIPYLEAINRTWIGWMRTYAPNWIGFVCFGDAAQTPLKVTSETNSSYTEASTTAYDSVGGNVVLDLHDYMAGDTRTTAPYDGRQFNGQLYPISQGGPEIGTGDKASYAPDSTFLAQHMAYVAPYKAFSISANIPLMIGEWDGQLETEFTTLVSSYGSTKSSRYGMTLVR